MRYALNKRILNFYSKTDWGIQPFMHIHTRQDKLKSNCANFYAKAVIPHKMKRPSCHQD